MNGLAQYCLIKLGRTRPPPATVQTPRQRAFAEAKRLSTNQYNANANARHTQVHGVSKSQADLNTKNHNKELKKRRNQRKTNQRQHQQRGQQRINTQNQAAADQSLQTYKKHHGLP